MKVIRVKMADLNVAQSPDMLITSGLGSCVGVVLYDEGKKIGGMAHVMLPDSSSMRNKTNLAKYADTAMDLLLEKLLKMGADKKRLWAKMAGGAQMFQFNSENDLMKIGARNTEAVKKKLKEFNIPLIAEDIGGSHGRTMEFYTETGKVIIKSVKMGDKEL
ncbi:chemotaxis protein CheD [Anoxybacter fermentans]|uniref:Probable chemoreceptor glutamine deamidase CheD n=1 Tax=Anoxybacter fermentans TaxID=1323375 RepID=A0A3S9SVV8_9FIRM|nr:chemotaxis protein CheD [Anoxybacter fermentans]AZR72370.1 chemotaxis protein CheD [Anoxybacter fermentans]